VMRQFVTYGPFDLPWSGPDRTITRADVRAFWKIVDKRYPDLRRRRGCYVFAVAASAMLPWYVGKTDGSLHQEAFTQDKLNKYNRHLKTRQRGKPVMFLVAKPRSRGRPEKTEIDELETFLIKKGRVRNSRLVNKRKTRAEHAWGIQGVYNTGRGKPSASASTLRKVLGI
jgi:hypothetical protein